jgi:hypothetical protein
VVSTADPYGLILGFLDHTTRRYITQDRTDIDSCVRKTTTSTRMGFLNSTKRETRNKLRSENLEGRGDLGNPMIKEKGILKKRGLTCGFDTNDSEYGPA